MFRWTSRPNKNTATPSSCRSSGRSCRDIIVWSHALMGGLCPSRSDTERTIYTPSAGRRASRSTPREMNSCTFENRMMNSLWPTVHDSPRSTRLRRVSWERGSRGRLCLSQKTTSASMNGHLLMTEVGVDDGYTWKRWVCFRRESLRDSQVEQYGQGRYFVTPWLLVSDDVDLKSLDIQCRYHLLIFALQ